jgi:hypothetical protein
MRIFIIFFTVLLTYSSLFSNELVWLNNYNNALLQSKKSNKPLLIYYTMPGCKACIFMKKDVFTNQEISIFLKENFVLLELDVKNKDVPENLRAKVTPTFEFINFKEQRVADTIIGGKKAFKFLELIEEAIEELPYRVID